MRHEDHYREDAELADGPPARKDCEDAQNGIVRNDLEGVRRPRATETLGDPLFDGKCHGCLANRVDL